MKAVGRGFTLLEMLVTLVVVSLVVSILAESLFQMNRLEGLLAGKQLQAQVDVVRTQWVRQAIGSLQPGDASGRGRFSGQARAMGGMTGNPIVLGGGGYGALKLYLAFDDTAGETVLWSGDRGSVADAPVALLHWPGNHGRFSYLDQQGQAHETWPPALGQQRKLPAAVALLTEDNKVPLVLIEVPADNNPLLSRQEYEAL